MAIYYVTAKDDLIIRDEVKRLIELPEISHHYASDLSLEELVEILTVVDMFAFEEGHWIDNVTSIKLLGNNAERLENAIQDCPPNKRVVFTQNTNFDNWRKVQEYKKKAINNLLLSKAKYVDKEAETEIEAVEDWAEIRAKEHYGLALTKASLKHIAISNTYLPQLIDTELRKLSLLKTSDKIQKLSENIVRQNTTRIPSEQVFQFVESLFFRKSDALTILGESLDSGAEATGILSNVFRRLSLLESSLYGDLWSIDEFRKLPKDIKDNVKKQTRNWNEQQIALAIELAGETDFRLKSLGIDEYDVMASFTKEVMSL